MLVVASGEAFLGSPASGPGALDIDLFGQLGGFGQHRDPVLPHFDEAAAGGGLPVRPALLGEADPADLQRRQERGVAGQHAEAVDWLEEATRSCKALQFPILHTRAHLWLGQAYEALDRREDACRAYQVVLKRWGQAKPKSITADEARARVSELGCGDTPPR